MSRPLSGGSPHRLWLDRGNWVLDVIHHVNISGELVRPSTESLSGQRSINSYFRSNPDQAQLARGAQKLMQSTGNGPRSYEALGGEWIPSDLLPGGERRGQDDADASLESQLAELSLRITALVALQEGLLVRLARLEGQVLDGAVATRGGAPEAASRATRVLGREARSRPGAPEEQELRAADSKPAPPAAATPTPAAATPAGAAPAAATPAAAAPAAARAQPAEPRARPRHELELPPFAELCKVVELLASSDLTLSAADPLAIDASLQHGYATAIVDESDEQLGLILMDLRATVCLGGSLMMQPPDQLEQQITSATPEPDSLAASNEICNTLASAINSAQTRYHVRCTGLEEFEIGNHAWATSVVTRRDLSDSYGGRTTLLACPGE